MLEILPIVFWFTQLFIVFIASIPLVRKSRFNTSLLYASWLIAWNWGRMGNPSWRHRISIYVNGLSRDALEAHFANKLSFAITMKSSLFHIEFTSSGAQEILLLGHSETS